MGGMLASAFAAKSSQHVFIYNRTESKARHLAQDHSNMHLTESPIQVVQRSDLVFICTKYAEGQKLVEELGAHLTDRQMLVTTISTLSLEDLEMRTTACVAKVIPSIVQWARGGVLLVSYGTRMATAEREALFNTLQSISTPFAVSDDQIRVCSDLTSCGPAFLSFMLLQWAEAAADRGKISHVEAEHLLTETLVGVSELLKTGMTLRDIIQKVAVPGGVTEAGLSSLSCDGQNTFRNLHHATSTHSHGTAVVNLSIRS
jgi:competence protein ComER